MRFQDQQRFKNGSGDFTAPDITSLGASEYTIGGVTIDRSGSVDPFALQLRQMLVESASAIKMSPRNENVFLRVTTFRDSNIEEMHGFVLTPEINVSEYPSIYTGGGTPLFQAAYEMVSAIIEYGKHLTEKRYIVNAIAIFITDGCDTEKGVTPAEIRKKIAEYRNIKGFSSFTTILIGVSKPAPDGGEESASERQQREEVMAALKLFKEQAGITHFINMGSATAAALAQLANFVSSSIIIKSSHMGTEKDVDNMQDTVNQFV